MPSLVNPIKVVTMKAGPEYPNSSAKMAFYHKAKII